MQQCTIDALNGCIIKNGRPEYQSYGDGVEKLSAEVFKHKKRWLGPHDVFLMFIDHVGMTLKPAPDVDIPDGILSEMLGADGISQLAKKFVDFVLSIPRSYQVFVPIPAIDQLEESVVILDRFSLERIAAPMQSPSAQLRLAALSTIFDSFSSRYFLKFEVHGYCTYDITSSAAKVALSTLKICLQQLKSNEFFIKSSAPSGLTSGIINLGFSRESFVVPKHHMVIQDPEQIEIYRDSTFELPIEICHFLENHSFRRDIPKKLFELGADTTKKSIQMGLIAAAKLHVSDSQETARMKWAIEWTFDSVANENPTMSFIQTCIALEAIYGEGNDGQALTQTLADRCAYLLATSLAGRKSTQEEFRKLYQLRSKIVHGNVASLGHDEMHLLRWGQGILELSIAKEIRMLKLPD